jgi:hypothetical protein
VISITNETVIPFSTVGEYRPSSRVNKRVHASTAWRWAKAGCKAVDGTMVKLESIRIGSATYTSVEALQRFADRLSAQPENRPRRLDFESRQDLVEHGLAAYGL